MRRYFSALLPWILILALLANQANAWASPLKVVITIQPIHSLAAGVMYGVSEPLLLIRGSASPHSYSLRPSDARMLQQADFIVWVGEALELFLKKPLASLARRSKVLTLLNQKTIAALVPSRQNKNSLKSLADGSGIKGHPHGVVDPHIWLDPLNAVEIVKLISQALSALDDGNSENYKRNSRQLIGQLLELHRTLKLQLEPIIQKPYMVYHDAYRLFEHRYKLNALGAITLSPDRQPGAQRLHKVRAVLIETGASCVFNQPQIKPTWLNSVLQGTTAKAASLDPIGLNLKPGRQAYFDLMHGLSWSLLSCLQDVQLNSKIQ